jgi:hypothetical protein
LFFLHSELPLPLKHAHKWMGENEAGI